MDIRRLELWEGRSATYMSNNSFSVIIEDQGEVTVELSCKLKNGARVSPLCLPYFRGTGSGVLSDENSAWWRNRQALYQAGGLYFNFPESTDEIITTTNTYWSLKKYGTENESHGVWKYSEMKSREMNNRYTAQKVDLVIPGMNVLYTAIRITNTSSTPLKGNPSFSVVLSAPLIESGSSFWSNGRYYTAYPLAKRESGINRFQTDKVFDDLKKFLTPEGQQVDASYVPGPTGTYDYMIGKLPEGDSIGYALVLNPRNQLVYSIFTPKVQSEGEYQFPNVTIGQNYYGRMDAPWALFDGATPQVMAATLGFNAGPKGTKDLTLEPGESKVMYVANAFSYYANPRMNLGAYSVDVSDKGFTLKRTKSSVMLEADTTFSSIRKLSKKLFFLSGTQA